MCQARDRDAGRRELVACSASTPCLIVSDDLVSHRSLTLSRGYLGLSTIILALFVANVCCGPAKTKFAATNIQRTFLMSLRGKFATLRFCIAVQLASGAAVSRPVSTVAALSTTGTVAARLFLAAGILIASNQGLIRVQRQDI